MVTLQLIHKASSSNHSFDDSVIIPYLCYKTTEHSFVINLETGDYEFGGASVAADTRLILPTRRSLPLITMEIQALAIIQINIAATSLSSIGGC
ncbi:hypothetical protein OK016_19245 [Vibrio chagasii]|nr:hypothetical protein [Vibrio chagasii]